VRSVNSVWSRTASGGTSNRKHLSQMCNPVTLRTVRVSDSSVVNSDGIRDGLLRSRGSIPSRIREFLFSIAPRPSLWPTQPPIQWVPGALSPRVRRPGCETAHSLPSSAEVKNVWSYSFIFPFVFVAWYLINYYLWINNSRRVDFYSYSRSIKGTDLIRLIYIWDLMIQFNILPSSNDSVRICSLL
jgi:hypothetical protein